jgi:hypothetical protein
MGRSVHTCVADPRPRQYAPRRAREAGRHLTSRGSCDVVGRTRLDPAQGPTRSRGAVPRGRVGDRVAAGLPLAARGVTSLATSGLARRHERPTDASSVVRAGAGATEAGTAPALVHGDVAHSESPTARRRGTVGRRFGRYLAVSGGNSPRRRRERRADDDCGGVR